MKKLLKLKVFFFKLDFAKIYTKLLAYIQNLRLKKYIEKNLIYIEDYSKDFDSLSLISDMIEKDNVKLSHKPQEVIKLYDNLLEYQNQLINLEKENQDGSAQIDLNFRSQIYSVFKFFFVGLFYLLNKKLFEAYTIMHHILEKVKEVSEFYERHNLSLVIILKELYEQKFTNLENIVRFIISKCFVRISKDKLDTNQSEKKEKTRPKYHGFMFEDMSKSERITKENFETIKDEVKISYEDYVEALEKNNYNNFSHMMQVPPNTKLIDPKPIVYDLTFQRFQYPKLDSKKLTDNKGIFSRALGYFFNK